MVAPKETITPLIWFYNGINNSKDDAQKFANGVRILTNINCHLRYNHAASPKVMEALTKILGQTTIITGVGVAVAGMTTLLATTVFTVIGGILVKPEIDRIQKNKSQLASREAREIIRILNANPYTHFIFVGHSQGADLIAKILDEIKRQAPREFMNLVHRISVITIGGLDVVHCNQAAKGRAFNLSHNDDQVANIAAPLYKKVFLPVRDICHDECSTFISGSGGHSANAYLKNRKFKEIIREYGTAPSLRFKQIIAMREVGELQNNIETQFEYMKSTIQKLIQLKDGFAVPTESVNDLLNDIKFRLQQINPSCIYTKLADAKIAVSFEIRNWEKNVNDQMKQIKFQKNVLTTYFQESRASRVYQSFKNNQVIISNTRAYTRNTKTHTKRQSNMCEKIKRWLCS